MAVIECPHCGAPVDVDEPEQVRSGHNASSGEPRAWVMREGGDEVHRCDEAASAGVARTAAPGKPPSARIQRAVAIVADQVGCDETRALTLLRQRAEALQYRLHNYALLVIEGMVSFDEQERK